MTYTITYMQAIDLFCLVIPFQPLTNWLICSLRIMPNVFVDLMLGASLLGQWLYIRVIIDEFGQ